MHNKVELAGSSFNQRTSADSHLCSDLSCKTENESKNKPKKNIPVNAFFLGKTIDISFLMVAVDGNLFLNQFYFFPIPLS